MCIIALGKMIESFRLLPYLFLIYFIFNSFGGLPLDNPHFKRKQLSAKTVIIFVHNLIFSVRLRMRGERNFRVNSSTFFIIFDNVEKFGTVFDSSRHESLILIFFILFTTTLRCDNAGLFF